MNIHEVLLGEEEGVAVTSRQVPAQPAGLPEARLYLGADVGIAHWSGERPRPGETVVALGDSGHLFASSGQATAGMRTPTFGGEPCRCVCPPSDGTAFWLSIVRQTAVVHVLDGATGALRQLVGRRELGTGVVGIGVRPALAVDPDAPYTLYVLDDRRRLLTLQTDANPTLQRGYWGIATFLPSGGQYLFSRFDGLTDPYGGTSFPPATEPDPPAVPGNCLSVVEGVPLVTMAKAPARYQALSGGAFVTRTLLRDGVPYATGLRGGVVRLTRRPARSSSGFVLATPDDATFEVVEFDRATDVVRRVIPLDLPVRPVALAGVCNRLLVLSAALDSFGT